MAKLKLGESEGLTPSEAVVKAASKVTVLTDSLGRKISVRRPGVLGQFHLVEIVGPELARNPVYLNMTMPVLWVVDIDGEPLHEPASKLELEAALQRLGEEGLDVLMTYVIGGDEGADPEEAKEKLGNS